MRRSGTASPPLSLDVMLQELSIPWIELGFRSAAGLVGLTAVSVVYVWALLWIGRCLGGTAKTALAFVIYLAMVIVIAVVFAVILTAAKDVSVRQSGPYLAVVICAWIATVVPGFIYIFRVKLSVLQRVGFFRPGGSKHAT